MGLAAWESATAKAPDGDRPLFSIIVPIAPGREQRVLQTIEADGSSEILVEEGNNPSRNRNRAAARAAADILAFTDDDCAVAPDWLDRAASFFEQHPDVDAVGGPQLNTDDESVFGRASGYALGSRFGTFNVHKRYHCGSLSLAATQRDLTSANLFLRREAFDRWGPFDERLWPNEETALLHKIETGGGKIAYDPTIVVRHQRRANLPGLAKQCFGYGRGRARQARIEGTSISNPGQTLPIAFAAYLLLLPLLVSWVWWAALPLAAYAIACAVASCTALSRTRDLACILMPAAFLTIHVSYPLGILTEALLGRTHQPEASDHPKVRRLPV